MTSDAVKLLEKDHDRLRGLLKELVSDDEANMQRRTDLLDAIETELNAHTTIEEEIFYPAFRKAGGEKAAVMFYEAIEEHRAVNELILPDVRKAGVETERFTGRAKVLKELIEHHAREEEKDLFPLAEKVIDKDEMKRIAEAMRLRKQGILGDRRRQADGARLRPGGPSL